MPIVLSNRPYHNILKWLWNDMKMNSSAGFQNIDSTRAVILVSIEMVDERVNQKTYLHRWNPP